MRAATNLAIPHFLIPIPEIQALSGAMVFSVQCFSRLFSRIVYVTLSTEFEFSNRTIQEVQLSIPISGARDTNSMSTADTRFAACADSARNGTRLQNSEA